MYKPTPGGGYDEACMRCGVATARTIGETVAETIAETIGETVGEVVENGLALPYAGAMCNTAAVPMQPAGPCSHSRPA